MPRLTSRGWSGPGGGRWLGLPQPKWWRATNLQVAGMWPYAGAASRPLVGTPIGRDLEYGSTVCMDPVSWFRAGLISNPSAMIYGTPGLGKSSIAGRIALGAADQGMRVMAIGDMKPDYRHLVTAMHDPSTGKRGQVIQYGGGHALNVLDQSSLLEAAERVGGDTGRDLRADALSRSANMVGSLIQIMRKQPLEDWEQTLLLTCVSVLMSGTDYRRECPTLPDVARLLENPTEEVFAATLTNSGARDAYDTMTRTLRLSLASFLTSTVGVLFSGRSRQALDLDAPAVCIDVSATERQTPEVQAAVLLASWDQAFASVEAANALADAGLAPQQNVQIIQDECWRPLRLEGANLVDKMDACTRLNRNQGVSHIYIAHTPKDQLSIQSSADRMKARGFTERAGIVITAGLSTEDLVMLNEMVPLSDKEILDVARWNTPSGWRGRVIVDPTTGKRTVERPPGCGKFLIKAGGRAGIQVKVELTKIELDLHNTNHRWEATDGAQVAADLRDPQAVA